MLTYELKKMPGMPLYEALYRCIRADILSGKLPADTKLPSKRALAENLKVSKITVENAYGQLLAEGYIRSEEKVGYFVEKTETPNHPIPIQSPQPEPEPENVLDLTANGPAYFPFSVWSRLQREVLLAYYFQEKKIPQIAQERGVNRTSVARALHRAEEKLRRYLKY